MRRLPLAFLKALVIVLLGLFGTVGGSIAAVFLTPAGRGLAGRSLSEHLDKLVNGDIEVGAVGGPLWGGLQIDRLVVRDTVGTIVLEADRVTVSYRILELLAGRYQLNDVTVRGLRLVLEKHRNGGWNIGSLLRHGPTDSTPAGPPPLVRFAHLTLADADIRLFEPWDPPDSARTPKAVALLLAEERRHPGRVIEEGPEGLRKLFTFRGLGGRFPVLQLSSPTRDPLHAEFDSLAVRVSDPEIDLRSAVGTATLQGNILAFDLKRATLPASRLVVAGRVDLGRGGPRFDVRAEAPVVALRDLRGFVPGLPDLSGSARATIFTRPDGRLATDIRSLDARGRQGHVTGQLTAVSGALRPVAFEGLDLTLQGADPLLLHGWVDSIPLTGTLDGHVLASGPLQALLVGADLTYRDSRVAGHPANHLSAVGLVHLGGVDGMIFDTLTIRESDLDLPTIREFVPSNPLMGRVAVQGTLTGAWKAVTWKGTAQHRDGDRPVSVVRGTAYINTRGPVTAFDVDVGLTPLVLNGLRGTWPDLPVQGDLTGSVQLHGSSDRFSLDGDLNGTLGHIAGHGIVQYVGDELWVDSLALSYDSLDLAAVGGAVGHTQLVGTMTGAGHRNASGSYTGRAAIALGSGWVREFFLDSAAATFAIDSQIVTIDTGFVHWTGGKLELAGTVARHAPGTGSLSVIAAAGDLGVFDSVVAALFPTEPDTAFEFKPLSGRGALNVVLTGALDSLAVDAQVEAHELKWRYVRLPSGRAEVKFGAGKAGPIGLLATVDTASWNAWSLNDATIRATGWRDSLAWSVAGRVGPTDTIRAGGRWRTAGDTVDLAVDSLDAALTAHTWHLAHATAAHAIAGSWRVDSAVFLATDGSGEFRVNGSLPGAVAGTATLTALGLDLRDVMGLLQRDTIGIVGSASADLAIGGTAKLPTIRGTFALTEGGYRDFRAPYLEGALDYAERKLASTVVLWRTGRPALTVAVDTLPIDLAFTKVRDRLLDGPLFIRATADSADLGILEAFTRNLRSVHGWLTADVVVTGGWKDPRLGGTLSVTDAAATLPGLGVRWDRTSAKIHLAKDSVVFDELTTHSGAGSMSVAKGDWVRFERGRSPTLDVHVRTDRFRTMDVRNYLTLITTTTGEGIHITGPVFGATLTGRGTVDEGTLYFADLITKQIVDLSDPATADLIDTALVRQARLGPSFSNQFIDSLRIQDFRLTVGEDFWLRSADANIKLSGSATVNKLARNYRLDGTLTAERGQYTLKLGFITRDFDVQRGTVRFLGTPDLNAELDLTAQHQVKATDTGGDITIEAKITGTLLVPKLTLVNNNNPQMVETDIVSYLMFGRSTATLQGTNSAEGARQQQAVSTAFSYILPALSSEIERTLISDLGVPVDYIQIRPGGVGTNSIEGSTSGVTTVTAGWQVGRQTYVALNAGICNTNVTDVSYRNFGASLEQRLSRDWRATLSVEPVFSCSSAPGTSSLATSSLYQLGLDLLWDREY